MYSDHAPIIARYAQSNPSNLARVAQFVLLTARWPFWRVPDAMASVDKLGLQAPCLFAWKAQALDHFRTHKNVIWADAMELSGLADPGRRERDLLALFASMPGMGLVKGGFLCQLAFDCAACLDVQNAERFSLSRNDLRADGASFKKARPATRARKIETYLDICRKLGGTAGLWDGWCQHMSDQDRFRYASADACSRLHVEAIGC